MEDESVEEEREGDESDGIMGERWNQQLLRRR